MNSIRMAAFAGMLLLSAPAAHAQLSLTNGLIAHWGFEDSPSGTNVADSIGSFPGVLSPTGTQFDPGGLSGQAMRFNSDSNGFVNMGDVLSLSNGNFSLVAWVKLEAGDTTDNRVVIARHDGGYRNGYFLVINTSTNILTPNVAHFVIGGTGTGAQTDPETPSSTTVVNQDGGWHLLVATHSTVDGEAIYVDGAPVEDTAPFLPFDTLQGIDFLLGGFIENGQPKGVFKGLIDEVRIYDRPLQPGEIDELYRLHSDRRDAIATTVVRGGPAPGDGGPAFAAGIDAPKGVVVDGAGAVFFSDSGQHRVRRIDPVTGIITTVAGIGVPGFSGDGGAGTNAQLNLPRGLALSGNLLLIADGGNHRVRSLNLTTGVINTLAGVGSAGSSGDGGPATAAELNTPMGITVDATGNIYISEFDGHVVRRIAGGVISSFAGTGTAGFSAAQGDATNTPVKNPAGLAQDANGRLYIAEFGNNVVRRVHPATGQTEIVAGSGSGISSGDGGNALQAGIVGPDFLAINNRGILYLSEWHGHRIRAIDLFSSGIGTVAGDGVAGFLGEGIPALLARFRNPSGIALASDGSLLVADNGNDRLRRVSFFAPGSLTAPPKPGGAIPLFTDNRTFRLESQAGGPVPWTLVDTNVLEVVPGTGHIVSTQSFHGFRLHAEFMTPTNGQDGNSGIFLQGRYEVQIFNSSGVAATNLDANDCGAIWGRVAPVTNACLPPGQWQSYDIEFQAAQWNGTNKVANARVTVALNGVVVQDNVAIPNRTQGGAAEFPSPGPILLQDNGSAVRFRNVVITPFDTPPAVDWVRIAGDTMDTNLTDRAHGTAVDRLGNMFVTGSFAGTARFGTNLVTSSGAEDVFLAKYSRDGDLLWVSTGGGLAADVANDVAVDGAGNPVITGRLGAAGSFGSTNVANSGQEDFFVAKYDGVGNLLWVQAAGGLENDRGHAVSTDRQGAVFVTGSSSNGGRLSSFMIKFAPDGALLWSRSGAGLAGDTEGLGIVADEQGGAYVVGRTVGDAQFGSFAVPATGSQEAYLLHIDGTGEVAWVTRSSGPGAEVATAIALAPDGSLFITGLANGDGAFGPHPMLNQGGTDGFLIKSTPQGTIVWLRQLVNTEAGPFRSIAADAAGDVYVTANHATNAFVGAYGLPVDGIDGLVAKFDGDGTLKWVQRIRGPGIELIGDIALSSTGNPHLVGSFSNQADVGGRGVSSVGAGDLFIARLGSTLALPPATHWRFDDPTTPQLSPADSGGFAARLSSTGAVFTTEAFSTNAIVLLRNTNGFIDFGDLPVTPFQPVTLSIMARTLPGDTNHMILLSDHNMATRRGFLLGLNGLGTNHHPGAVIFTPTGDLSDGIIAPAPVNDGRWHSLILTYQPFLGAQLFIDGQVRGTSPARPLVREGGRLIGGGAWSADAPFGAFDGWLDELIVYDRSLSPEEVAQQALYPEETVIQPPIRAQFAWVREIPSDGGSEAHAVVEDDQGHLYVTGSFNGQADFGGISLVSRGSNDVYLAKYRVDGSLVWARQAGGSRGDAGLDLTIDPDGNIIVCGAISGAQIGQTAIFFDGQVIFTRGQARGFMAKYNPGGQILLARELWGPATGIDTDSGGNIFVGGNLVDPSRVTLHTIELNGTGLSDAWIARFSSVGNPLWAYNHGGAGNDRVTGLKMDGDNAFYLAGNFTGNMLVNGLLLTTGNAAELPYLFRHSALDGNIVWARQGTNSASASAQSLLIDGPSARLSGQYLGSLRLGGFSLSITNTNGFNGFSATFNAAGVVNGASPAMQGISTAFKQRPDSLYLAGSFRGTTTAGAGPVISDGGRDTLILRRDAQGMEQLVKRIASPVDVEPAPGTGLAADRFGNLYLAGNITAPTNTPFTVRFDGLRINPTNQQTAFLTRMSSEVTILRQPEPLVATNLDNTFLRVLADSPAPLSYQWYHNSNAIPGATGAGLFLNNVQLLQPGTYHVVASNNLGYAISSPALVRVELPPVFVIQPSNTVAQQSQPATLGAVVAGNPPLSLQWNFNGAPLPGATNQTLILPNAGPGNVGLYQLFATNSFGTRSSVAVSLDVLQPGLLPEIQTQPQSQTNAAGSLVSLTVAASGQAPLLYQWFKNNQPLPDRRDATLLIGGVQLNDAGDYHVVVSNLLGSVTSSNVTLTVFTPVPVTITNHPQSTNLLAGQDLVLTVGGSGTGPLRYQWRRENTVLPGQTNATLFLPNVPLTAAGSYFVRVFNDFSTAQSTAASVGIQQAPVFTRQPAPVPGATNTERVTISVDVQGAPTPTLQWFKDNVALTNNFGYFGVNSPNLIIPATTPAHIGGYHVRAANSVGQTLSTVAPLGMNFPPVILAHPTSRNLPAGANTTFSLIVTGAPPLFLSWSHGGSLLPGATNLSLTLTNLNRNHTGIYRVAVTNLSGGTVSSNAFLRVLVPQRLENVRFNAGAFEFLLGDANGSNFIATNLPVFEVQFSSNLVDWVTMGAPLTLENGRLLYRDDTPNLPGRRFYRVIEP